MKFDYSGFLSSAPDTGEEIIIFRPEVPLRVHGPQGWRDFLALVDSGSDNTILPRSIADDLGIVVTEGKGPPATAFGGQPVPLSFADVELELISENESWRWMTRVYFAEAASREDETLILWHDGFLDFFTTTLIGADCALELQPNDYIPLVKQD